MAGKKKVPFTVVQIGQARATDASLEIKVSKKLARMLKSLADETGVVDIPVDQFNWLLQPEGQAIAGEPVELIVNQTQAPNVLDIAKEIIFGDREQAYGDPRFNLDSIAQFWTVYLSRKFPNVNLAMGLTAEDVAQFMVLLKMSRLIHNPSHKDSLVDQAGYVALQARIQGL